jgi:hypothetical protein
LYAMATGVIDLNDPAGHTYCTSNLPLSSGCDETITAAGWPTEFGSSINSTHQGRLTYEGLGCPPRAFETSCDHLQMANFSLRSTFNNTANKGGSAETVMGAARLLPKY